MFISRKKKRRLEKIFISISNGFKLAFYHGFFLPALLLPWYVWALLFYPKITLWWLAISLSFLFTGLSFIKERSVLYWIIPCIFLFNNIQIFKLPWPYIKLSYISALSICFVASLKGYSIKSEEDNREIFSFDFQLFYLSAIIAALIGILSYLLPNSNASISEFKMCFRTAPFINQIDNFISIRYLWLWSCGVAFYWAIYKFIKNIKDVYLIFWAMQLCSLFVAAFGFYSYIVKKYMVDFYFYERRICSTFSSPAVLADITTVILIIGVFLLKNCKSLLAKIILIVLIIINLITLLLSGCRANIIILLLFGMLWFLTFLIKSLINRNWKPLILIFVILVFIIGGIYNIEKISLFKKTPLVERTLYWKNMINKKHNFISILFEGRKWHWQCGLKMVKSSPLWGVGIGHFEQEYAQYKTNKDMFSLARAHNVLLRIFAEGGLITFLSYLVFLTFAFFRLSRGFSKSNIKEFPEESKILQVIFISFLALFFLSMFSDIVLVREECIFFISILAACATRMYKHLPTFSTKRFMSARNSWKHAEKKIRLIFKKAGWDYFGKVKLITLFKLSAFFILLILFVIGMSKIKKQKLIKLKMRTLSYGFYNKVPGGNATHIWHSMGNEVALISFVNHDIFYIGYRALNSKTALLNQNLKVYINGELTVEVPLNSMKKQWVYCDVSGLYNQNIIIEYKTDKTFIPLKEKWFADTYTYGAVVTKPIWINKRIYKKTIKKRPGIFIDKWKKGKKQNL